MPPAQPAADPWTPKQRGQAGGAGPHNLPLRGARGAGRAGRLPLGRSGTNNM